MTHYRACRATIPSMVQRATPMYLALFFQSLLTAGLQTPISVLTLWLPSMQAFWVQFSALPRYHMFPDFSLFHLSCSLPSALFQTCSTAAPRFSCSSCHFYHQPWISTSNRFPSLNAIVDVITHLATFPSYILIQTLYIFTAKWHSFSHPWSVLPTLLAHPFAALENWMAPANSAVDYKSCCLAQATSAMCSSIFAMNETADQLFLGTKLIFSTHCPQGSHKFEGSRALPLTAANRYLICHCNTLLHITITEIFVSWSYSLLRPMERHSFHRFTITSSAGRI